MITDSKLKADILYKTAIFMKIMYYISIALA